MKVEGYISKKAVVCEKRPDQKCQNFSSRLIFEKYDLDFQNANILLLWTTSNFFNDALMHIYHCNMRFQLEW
jgi:hypothetical protein